MGPFFMQDVPIEGLLMTILAYKVDNERVYKEMIQDFWELFWRYLVIAVVAIFGLILVGGGILGAGKLWALALAHPSAGALRERKRACAGPETAAHAVFCVRPIAISERPVSRAFPSSGGRI
jgi:hypothetical protein